MSATPRPATPRTTSTQSASPSRGLQHLLRRVKTALRRGNLSSHSVVATPALDHAPLTQLQRSSDRLSAQIAPEPLGSTSQSHSRPSSSTTNLANLPPDVALPSSSSFEPLLAVDSASTSPIDSVPSKHNLDTLLAVDDDENIPDSIDESIIPLAHLGRAPTGIAEAKARQLFERHGLTYHHARPDAQGEPAPKIRRVERHVRMRVRWTCHSCRTIFGQDKFCPGCGHRRCFECERDPRRRIKMPVREDMAQEPDLRIQPSAVQTLPSRPRPTQNPSHAAQSAAAHAPVVHLPSHGAEATSPWRCTIQIGQPRPHTTVFEDSIITPTHKRDCHQCETTTERVDATACTSCHHQYCILCPIYTNHTSHSMQIRRTVPVVERVYRKPRQRVRFHCEHCDTQYTDRNHCTSCGHERCETCPRFPPKKRKASPDPLAWQALEAKIANRHVPDPLMNTTTNNNTNEPPLQQDAVQPQARL